MQAKSETWKWVEKEKVVWTDPVGKDFNTGGQDGEQLLVLSFLLCAHFSIRATCLAFVDCTLDLCQGQTQRTGMGRKIIPLESSGWAIFT